MQEFAVGIISGLVTSGILVFVAQFYLKAIKPWIEELLYKDVEIQGEWIGKYPDMPDTEDIVDIKRQGHRVQGTVTITAGPDKGTIYEFDGSFKNLIVTATYVSANRSRLDRGAFAMRLEQNGLKFSGQYAYYQDDDNAIHPALCNWTKSAA
jgi:hypothetical protein